MGVANRLAGGLDLQTCLFEAFAPSAEEYHILLDPVHVGLRPLPQGRHYRQLDVSRRTASHGLPQQPWFSHQPIGWRARCHGHLVG